MNPSRRRKRWAIRVTRQDGTEYYMRYFSPPAPEHPVMTFRSRREAELNADTYLRPDLESGCVMTVVMV